MADTITTEQNLDEAITIVKSAWTLSPANKAYPEYGERRVEFGGDTVAQIRFTEDGDIKMGSLKILLNGVQEVLIEVRYDVSSDWRGMKIESEKGVLNNHIPVQSIDTTPDLVHEALQDKHIVRVLHFLTTTEVMPLKS